MIYNIHLIITGALTGIIWLIQVVHYPSFRYVDPKKLCSFHKMHTSSITPIVAPLMVAELGLTLYDVYDKGDHTSWIYLLLVGMIWLSTFLIQVPSHNKLAHKWNEKEVMKLITSNWIRTILWSIKLVSMVLLI